MQKRVVVGDVRADPWNVCRGIVLWSSLCDGEVEFFSLRMLAMMAINWRVKHTDHL